MASERKELPWWVSLSVIVGFFGWLGWVATQSDRWKAEDAAAAKARVDLPFASEMSAKCTEYKAAPNEIQKSRVFREAEGVMKNRKFDRVQGVLERIATDQGGSNATLYVSVAARGGDARFVSEHRRGTRVFNAAATMREGECVEVSGRTDRVIAVMEKSQVCDRMFGVKLAKIAPCKQP